MTTYTAEIVNGQPTIRTSRIVTHQQGSWKWQLRLARSWYIAIYSRRAKAWIWKSVSQSGSFSGGNIRKPHTVAEGSLHHQKLDGMALCALAVVLGEN